MWNEINDVCFCFCFVEQMMKFTTRWGAFNANELKEWIRKNFDDCVQKLITLSIFIIDKAPARSRADQAVDIEKIVS